MQDISPVSGWALNYIVELDGHVPGVCRAFLRASAERRQVVAALLSTCHPHTDLISAQSLGTLIIGGDHRSILKEAFGHVPTGMRGALARSGSQPQSRTFYRRLFEVLAEGRASARVIQQLLVIDFERLRIVEALPEEIRTPNLVSRIRSIRAASDISTLFGLLTEHGVDRKALADALTNVAVADELPELWERWAAKCAFPPHPIPVSVAYVPITSGLALRRMALRFRNCARRYLAQVLDGESAFAEFHHRGRERGSAPLPPPRRMGSRQSVWAGEFGRLSGAPTRSGRLSCQPRH